MENPLPLEIKREQAHVEDIGYYASCDYHFKEGWDQDKTGISMAMAATHMMTIVLIMKTGEKDLLLSPDAILKHMHPVDGLDPYRLEFFLRNLGIEERFPSEIVCVAAPDHQYDSTGTRRMWKISKFDKYDTLSTIVMALKKNFGSHGRQYPVLACCYRMEPLTSEEAAQTSMSEPYRFGTYNSRLDSYSDELNFRRSPPNGNAMLITGMYTIRDQPNLLDNSFEVKKSYGKKWGVGGKVWLTADFFDIIFIPVMKGDDLAFDFDTRLAAKNGCKLAAK